MRRLVPAASPHAVAPIKHRSLRTFRRKKMPLLIEKSTSSRLLRAAMRPTLCALLLFSIFGKATPAQEPAAQHAQAVTPLANLLEEAEKNNRRSKRLDKAGKRRSRVRRRVRRFPVRNFRFSSSVSGVRDGS